MPVHLNGVSGPPGPPGEPNLGPSSGTPRMHLGKGAALGSQTPFRAEQPLRSTAHPHHTPPPTGSASSYKMSSPNRPPNPYCPFPIKGEWAFFAFPHSFTNCLLGHYLINDPCQREAHRALEHDPLTRFLIGRQ